MRKIWLVFVLMLVAVPAFAQAPVRGRPFLNEPVNSATEYAQAIKSCRTREEIRQGDTSPFLNLSCETLVEEFNKLAHLPDVTDRDDLAEYISGLAFLPCPSERQVEISRVINGDEVDYFWRAFRPGERCLVDQLNNAYVSSAVCGQWIRTEFPYVFTGTGDPAQPSQATINEMVERSLAERNSQGESQVGSRPEPFPTSDPSGSSGLGGWLSRNKKPLLIGAAVVGGLALLFARSSVEIDITNENRNGAVPAGASFSW